MSLNFCQDTNSEDLFVQEFLRVLSDASHKESNLYSTEKQAESIVSAEKMNPEVGASGSECAMTGCVITPTIAHNGYLEASEILPLVAAEGAMDYSVGYYSIHRALSQHPTFKASHMMHREVLRVILEHCAWKPRKFNDHGKIIELNPGELCVSYRELMNLCGKGCTKNWIEGALRIFSKSSETASQILRHEVRHVRIVITITHKESYDLICRGSQTASQNQVRQQSDTNEELKYLKEQERDPPTPLADKGGTCVIDYFFQPQRNQEPQTDRPFGPTPLPTVNADPDLPYPKLSDKNLQNEPVESDTLRIQHNVNSLSADTQAKTRKRRAKEVKSEEPKIAVRDTVFLTQKQIDTAREKFGARFEIMCDRLDSYKESSGNEYQSDAGLFKLNSWLEKATREKESGTSFNTPKGVDRRQKNPDGTFVDNPLANRF